MCDGQGGKDKCVTEIQVTPEMVEAGAVYLCASGFLWSDRARPDQIRPMVASLLATCLGQSATAR